MSGVQQTDPDPLAQERWRTAAIRPGKASGRLLGGNLSVLTALVGTPWLPEFDGAILFIEDVGEAEYRIDRMLSQLALAGILEHVHLPERRDVIHARVGAGVGGENGALFHQGRYTIGHEASGSWSESRSIAPCYCDVTSGEVTSACACIVSSPPPVRTPRTGQASM